LHDRLANLTPPFLLDTIEKWINNKIIPRRQAKAKASYVPKLTKQSGQIDWGKSASFLERFIRAMNPWPTAYTFLKDNNNTLIKIISTDNKPLNINRYQTGELFLHNNNLSVQCGTNALVIKEIQLAGKKRITANELLRGHTNFIGSAFA
jgi:methionyl-tRNA formyltransferase